MPASNSACEDAFELSPSNSTVILGTTISASLPTNAPCGGPRSTKGVWYSVEGEEGQLLRASTCSNGTNFASVVTVISGGCRSYECIGVKYYYEGRCNGYGAILDWESSSTTYYIFVSGPYGGIAGNFELTVEEVMRPSNDECTGAIMLALDSEALMGSTFDASIERINFSFCGSYIQSPGLWYAIEGTGSGLRASTCLNHTEYSTEIAASQSLSQTTASTGIALTSLQAC